MLMAMQMIVLETTTGGFPVLPVVLSTVATVLVFVLVRFGIYLYRSGEVAFSAKRIIDLDPRIVKLSIRVVNQERRERSLTNLALYEKAKEGYALLARAEVEPLLRDGPDTFLIRDPEGYGFRCPPFQSGEIVVEFTLPEKKDSIYLGGINRSGKFVVSSLSLSSSENQWITFRKGKIKE